MYAASIVRSEAVPVALASPVAVSKEPVMDRPDKVYSLNSAKSTSGPAMKFSTTRLMRCVKLVFSFTVLLNLTVGWDLLAVAPVANRKSKVDCFVWSSVVTSLIVPASV